MKIKIMKACGICSDGSSCRHSPSVRVKKPGSHVKHLHWMHILLLVILLAGQASCDETSAALSPLSIPTNAQTSVYYFVVVTVDGQKNESEITAWLSQVFHNKLQSCVPPNHEETTATPTSLQTTSANTSYDTTLMTTATTLQSYNTTMATTTLQSNNTSTAATTTTLLSNNTTTAATTTTLLSNNTTTAATTTLLSNNTTTAATTTTLLSNTTTAATTTTLLSNNTTPAATTTMLLSNNTTTAATTTMLLSKNTTTLATTTALNSSTTTTLPGGERKNKPTRKPKPSQPNKDRIALEIRDRVTQTSENKTTGLFQGIDVSCANETAKKNTKCLVMLQLKQRVPTCCILRTLCAANKTSSDIHLVGKTANRIGLLQNQCNSNIQEQKSFTYTGQAGASCEESATANVVPQRNSTHCGAGKWNNTCSCSAYCNGTDAYYTFQISLQDSRMNLSYVLSLISKITQRSNCPSSADVSCPLSIITSEYKDAKVECGKTASNLLSCRVILGFGHEVPICNVSAAVMNVFRSEKEIRYNGQVTRAAICGNSKVSDNPLKSKFMWININLKPATFCTTIEEAYILSCQNGTNVLVQLDQRCVQVPFTAPSPNVTTAQPNTTTISPNVTTVQPNTTTTSPNVTTVQPNTTTISPNVTTVQPNTTATSPNVTTVQPNTTATSPNVTTVQPNTTTTSPNVTTVQPNTTTTSPNVTTVQPNTTTISPNVTTVQPNTTATSPNVTTVQPNTTATSPNVTTVQPNTTTTSPNVTTVQPNTTTISPNVTTIQPNITTTSPNVTTVQPNTTTTSPNVTTAQPNTTTSSVHVTSSPLSTTAQTLNATATADNVTLSAESQANALLERTGDVSNLNSSQVDQLVSQLENLLSGPTVSLALGNTSVHIVSNLLGASPEVLSDSSNRIIGIVDTVGLKLVLGGEPETLLSPAVALSVKPADGSNFQETFFSISDPNHVQVRGDSRLRRSVRTDIPQGSIRLPPTLTQDLTNEQQQLASRVQFNFYQESTVYQDRSLGTERKLNSGILGASVANLSITELQDDVVIHLRNTEPVPANFVATCVFWDFTLNDESGGWNPKGCFVRSSTDNVTVCGCNHLTSFAILLDLSREPLVSRVQATILTFITYIGCGISAIFLSITLLTYLAFGKLRKDIPSKILIQLCLALLLLNLVFMVDAWLALYPDAVGLCISTALFLHYFLLVTFTWMGLEAVHMYLALVKVFNSHISRYMLKFSLVGWGVPMIVVIIVIAIDKDNYGLVSYGKFPDGTSDDFCWLKNDIAFYVAVVAYFCFIFVFNLAMFVVVLIQLCRIKRQNPHNAQHRTTLQDVRSVAGIMILLGFTWGFAFFAWGPVNLPFMYLFAIFNSLQGFFIFVFFCAVKENVRKQWRTYLCCGRMRLAENSEWSRTATQKTVKASVTGLTSLHSSKSSKSNNSSSSSSFLVSDSSEQISGIGSPFEDRAITADEDPSTDVVLNEINRQYRHLPVP